MKKMCCLLLAVCCLSLGACNSGEGYFRYDLKTGIASLDPQFTTEADAQLVIANTMEGLLRRLPDGSIEKGLCESYALSEDALTYTFVLRPELRWADGEPLTAADFVFAFRRMMNPDGLSPYAQDYREIWGAADIMAGLRRVEDLGVTAQDERTLVIRLENTSEFFLDKLANPAAVPCSERYFTETRGRYGMDTGMGEKKVFPAFLACGPFQIKSWNNQKSLILTPNPQYHGASSVLPEQINLYIGREEPFQLLQSGKADGGSVSAAHLQEAADAGLACEGYDNTIWGLVFNQRRQELALPGVRCALQAAIDRSQLAGLPGVGFAISASLVPPVSMVGSENYRDLAGEALRPVYSPTAARAMFYQAMEEAGIEQVGRMSVIMPKDSPCAEAAPYIQQMWQSSLSFAVDVELLEQEELESRLLEGNYDIALTVLSSTAPEAGGTLTLYQSDDTRNAAGYHSVEFDRLLGQALAASTVEEATDAYSNAEDLLLADAVVVPLYQETTYFAIARDIQDLGYSPNYNNLFFRGAYRG